jgi:hypothetical protein
MFDKEGVATDVLSAPGGLAMREWGWGTTLEGTAAHVIAGGHQLIHAHIGTDLGQACVSLVMSWVRSLNVRPLAFLVNSFKVGTPIVLAT